MQVIDFRHAQNSTNSTFSSFTLADTHWICVELLERSGYLEYVPNEPNIDEKFARLQNALQQDHEKELQDAIFDLGALANNWEEIPDEVVERLLTLLRNEEMYKSPYAGHLLTFFEFESPNLTDRQKWLCIGFLNALGINSQIFTANKL